jgi:hypothetical protein
MAQVLDLNARRAARSEAENIPHKVALGFNADGTPRVFELKPVMPVEYMDLLGAGQLGAALRILLVDPDQWEQFRMGEPNSDDLEAITQLYAVSVPESDGSPSFSTNGGPTSNVTSLPATDLISRTPAMVQELSGFDGSQPSSGGSPRTRGSRGPSTGRRGATGKSSQP